MTESSADLPAALPSLEECFKKYIIQSDERFKRIDQLLDDLPNRIIESLQKHGLIKGCSNDNEVKPMKPTLEKALDKGNGIVESTSLPTEVETSIPDQPPMVIEAICEEVHNNTMICPQEEGLSSISDLEQFERALMVERQPYIDPYLGEKIQIKSQPEDRQIWGLVKNCSEKMTIHYQLDSLHVSGKEERLPTHIYAEEVLKKSLTKFRESSESKHFHETRRDDFYIIWDPGPKPMQHPRKQGRGSHVNQKVSLNVLRPKERQHSAEKLRAQEVSNALVCLGHYDLQEDGLNQSCPKGVKLDHFSEQEHFISLLNLQEKLQMSRPNRVEKLLQVQFDRTRLHEQNFQPSIWSQIWPTNHMGLIPFDPGIIVKLLGWKIEWQQCLASGGELKRMLQESLQNRQPIIMHLQGPEKVKVLKPELKRMNEADINAFKAEKVKRPATTQALKEVLQLSLTLLALMSLGIVLTFSRITWEFVESTTKHTLGWIPRGNEIHQALPWVHDQLPVRSIRNFKEPYFEATHRRLGYDVAGKKNQATDEIMTLGTRSNSKGPAMMELVPSMINHYKASSLMELKLTWRATCALIPWAISSKMAFSQAQPSKPMGGTNLVISTMVNLGFLAIISSIRSWCYTWTSLEEEAIKRDNKGVGYYFSFNKRQL